MVALDAQQQERVAELVPLAKDLAKRIPCEDAVSVAYDALCGAVLRHRPELSPLKNYAYSAIFYRLRTALRKDMLLRNRYAQIPPEAIDEVESIEEPAVEYSSLPERLWSVGSMLSEGYTLREIAKALRLPYREVRERWQDIRRLLWAAAANRNPIDSDCSTETVNA